MKKLTILIILSVINLFNVDAQNFTFIFNPKETSNDIDSIKANVLTTGKNYISIGSNQISFTITSVNINSIPDNISVYPNPFDGQTQIQFYSPQDDDVRITLFNAAGQILASSQKKINQGLQKLKITTTCQGVCIINLTGNHTKFSQKILVTKSGKNNIIEFIGINSQEVLEKSAVEESSKVVHFFIYSSDNITKIADTLSISKTYEVEFYECKDADGKNYPVVQIGGQWWMSENLAYLPLVDSSKNVSQTEPFYYAYGYEGKNVSEAKATDNYKTFGVLYNWPAALNACPDGWHLPTHEEWKQLAQYINNQKDLHNDSTNFWNDVGTHLKAINGWIDNGLIPLIHGTDNFGFSGLPGGFCYFLGGIAGIGEIGHWWSSTEYDYDSAWRGYLRGNSHVFYQSHTRKESGFSIRCVRD